MKDTFVATQNSQRFQGACDDLLTRVVGVDLISMPAPAGVGKTTLLQRVATMNRRASYIRYLEHLSPTGLLREIAFAVAGARPRGSDACFSLIEEELARERRLILIDEADRLSLRHLNMVRDLSDHCRVGILLAGEEPLKSKLSEERRLASRVRQEIRLEPISQADILVFYEKALDQQISPEFAAAFARHAEGNFRLAV